MITVSTRSRPKAAGLLVAVPLVRLDGFNTQPPEGGWRITAKEAKELTKFQHAAARRRLVEQSANSLLESLFQHAAARRRLG